MHIESRIVGVTIRLTGSGEWTILITKVHSSGEDAYEHTYTRSGGYGDIRDAMEAANQLVTPQVKIAVDIME